MLVTFKAKGPGYVGIGFHFHTRENHYVFEIFDSKKCRLRQAEPGGKYKVIEEIVDECTYTPGQDHALVLRREENSLIVLLSGENPSDLKLVLNKEITWGLTKGTFGLMAFKTEVDFHHIQIMPNHDYDMKMDELKAKGLDTGGATATALTDSAKATAVPFNDKDPKKKKLKRKKKNKKDSNGDKDEKEEEEEDVVNELKPMKDAGPKVIKTCADYHEKKNKLKFCEQHFFGAKEAVNHCMHNYCSVCCQSMNADDIQALKECNAGCETEVIPQVSAIWKYCIDSPYLRESVYPFCEAVADPNEVLLKMKCQARMCQTCCSMANAEFDIDITNEDVFTCLSECEDRYLISPLSNQKKD